LKAVTWVLLTAVVATCGLLGGAAIEYRRLDVVQQRMLVACAAQKAARQAAAEAELHRPFFDDTVGCGPAEATPADAAADVTLSKRVQALSSGAALSLGVAIVAAVWSLVGFIWRPRARS